MYLKRKKNGLFVVKKKIVNHLRSKVETYSELIQIKGRYSYRATAHLLHTPAQTGKRKTGRSFSSSTRQGSDNGCPVRREAGRPGVRQRKYTYGCGRYRHTLPPPSSAALMGRALSPPEQGILEEFPAKSPGGGKTDVQRLYLHSFSAIPDEHASPGPDDSRDYRQPATREAAQLWRRGEAGRGGAWRGVAWRQQLWGRRASRETRAYMGHDCMCASQPPS